MDSKDFLLDTDGLDRLTLMISGNEQVVNIPELLIIRDESIELLQEQACKSAALIEYYNSVKIWYEYELDEIRAESERTYSELDRLLRIDPNLIGQDTKERHYRSLVDSDSLMIEVKDRMNKYLYITKRLNGLVRALERRDDRLSQVYSRYKGIENRLNG